jgi:hypothetical protein
MNKHEWGEPEKIDSRAMGWHDKHHLQFKCKRCMSIVIVEQSDEPCSPGGCWDEFDDSDPHHSSNSHLCDNALIRKILEQ